MTDPFTTAALRYLAASRLVYGIGALIAPKITGRLFGLNSQTDAGDTRVCRRPLVRQLDRPGLDFDLDLPVVC